MIKQVFLGLGSNIENREGFLRQAVEILQEQPQIEVIRKSSIYETPPFGYLQQSKFLNAVIEIQTSYSPEELLQITQNTEEKLGRKRLIHWGPRTIDVDLLLFEDCCCSATDLILPHPGIQARAFVLLPLQEIYNDKLAGIGYTCSELLKALDSSEIAQISKYCLADQW